jgi:hypothetical protein
LAYTARFLVLCRRKFDTNCFKSDFTSTYMIF